MTQNQAMTPFLQPHQLTYIKKQLHFLVGAFYFSGDYRVLDASRQNSVEKILAAVPDATPEQRALLAEAAHVRDKEEEMRYVLKLEPLVIPFPEITAVEIKKLFPKVKKLVLPPLEGLDRTKLTYLGWRDIATSSLYLVCRVNGKWKGIECRYVSGQKNRSYICTWCGRALPGDEVALVTSQIKMRNIPDGYKTAGNHLCLDSFSCNSALKTTDGIDAFLALLK